MLKKTLYQPQSPPGIAGQKAEQAEGKYDVLRIRHPGMLLLRVRESIAMFAYSTHCHGGTPWIQLPQILWCIPISNR